MRRVTYSGSSVVRIRSEKAGEGRVRESWGGGSGKETQGRPGSQECSRRHDPTQQEASTDTGGLTGNLEETPALPGALGADPPGGMCLTAVSTVHQDTQRDRDMLVTKT